MRCRHLFLRILLVVGLAASGSAGLSPAMAQLSSENVHDFLADPAALLVEHPHGGALLIARVRDLSASDPATLDALVGLLPGANPNQATAIGIGLGQTAMAVVKTDQAYAGRIQQAIVGADESQNAVPDNASGTAKPRIGSAVKTVDQVEGVTEQGTQPVAAGSEVYRDELVRTGVSGKAELLFADSTNLSIGPVTEIRLDKFVYDPAGGQGNVVINVTEGTFRFITGVQSHRNYVINTPVATLGVRGTTFLARMNAEFLELQIVEGEMFGTSIKNLPFELKDPKWGIKIDQEGNLYPSPVTTPLVTFADLGSPVTNVTQGDARTAFALVTGNSSIGTAGIGTAGGGGGGAGGGGGGTGGTGTGTGDLFGLTGGGPSSSNFRTFVTNTPDGFLSFPLTSSAGSALFLNAAQSVTPRRF